MRDIMIRKYLIVLSLFCLQGCFEKRSSNVVDVFKYWTGQKAPSDIVLLKGQYWQSAHWTKEYEVYLKFVATNDWWKSFITENQLRQDSSSFEITSDAPDWFKIPKSATKYNVVNGFDQGSLYFRDSISGICYIYEIQL